MTAKALLSDVFPWRFVPTDWHGESAAHLLWVLAQHDVAHGAQIGVLRDAIER
jgi:hypothetical protein